MEKLFVPYDIALALKEIGFDERCAGYYRAKDLIYEWGSKESFVKSKYRDIAYGEITLAPLYDQVISWMVSKHKLHVIEYPIKIETGGKTGYRWRWAVDDLNNWESTYHDNSDLGHYSIQEALSRGIKKAIELVTSK
jgi:hypothetical protein